MLCMEWYIGSWKCHTDVFLSIVSFSDFRALIPHRMTVPEISGRGRHRLLFSQNMPHPSALCICSIAELLMAFEVDKGAVSSLSD